MGIKKARKSEDRERERGKKTGVGKKKKEKKKESVDIMERKEGEKQRNKLTVMTFCIRMRAIVSTLIMPFF